VEHWSTTRMSHVPPSLPHHRSSSHPSHHRCLPLSKQPVPTREWIGRGAPDECAEPMEEVHFVDDTNRGTEARGSGPHGELRAEKSGYGGMGKTMLVRLGCGCETEGVECAIW
jgi:hypothetical protein